MISLPGYGDLCFTVQDLNERIKWRGMLAQSLAFVKGEKSYGSSAFAYDLSTNYGPILIIDQVSEAFYFWRANF